MTVNNIVQSWLSKPMSKQVSNSAAKTRQHLQSLHGLSMSIGNEIDTIGSQGNIQQYPQPHKLSSCNPGRRATSSYTLMSSSSFFLSKSFICFTASSVCSCTVSSHALASSSLRPSLFSFFTAVMPSFLTFLHNPRKKVSKKGSSPHRASSWHLRIRPCECGSRGVANDIRDTNSPSQSLMQTSHRSSYQACVWHTDIHLLWGSYWKSQEIL